MRLGRVGDGGSASDAFVRRAARPREQRADARRSGARGGCPRAGGARAHPDRGGFTTGSEREFSGKTDTFDHVVARTLVFEDVAGANTYLDWLGTHGDDILGRADATEVALPGDSGVALVLVPCGICKKELPTYLAGWRRGEVALTLLAAGSGANPERFLALVRQLDETRR